MKVYNIKNVDKFFEVVDSCKGKVEIISAEGDRLNLKSKLCQFIALSKLFGDEQIISELELVAYEPEDVDRLMQYMIERA